MKNNFLIGVKEFAIGRCSSMLVDARRCSCDFPHHLSVDILYLTLTILTW